MTKKVAIVGAHERGRGAVPWQDESVHIWTVNEHANLGWVKRWDAIIQIHKPGVYMAADNKTDPHHWQWLQKNHGEDKLIYMQDVNPLVPNSIKYPRQEINQEFTSTLTYKDMPVENMGCSIAYCMALALYQGYDQIDIYGAEMAHFSQYRSQRANFAFWVGVATGMKVPVNLHCSRGLFDIPAYGYEDMTYLDRLYGYQDGLGHQREELVKQIGNLDGALQMISQLMEEE